MPGKIKQATDRSHLRELSRREFIGRIAGAGAVAAGANSGKTYGRRRRRRKPPPEPAGTVPNSAVLAEKNPALKPHSERPLTGSVAAENHNFAVTPNDRMFIRNNLLTPELDAAKHRLTVKGLVERELTFSLDELKKLLSGGEHAGNARVRGFRTRRLRSERERHAVAADRRHGLPEVDRRAPARRPAGRRHQARGGARRRAGRRFRRDRDRGARNPLDPLAKAMEENTLIAFGMNDGPLPKIHGYPLRLVVPGGWARRRPNGCTRSRLRRRSKARSWTAATECRGLLVRARRKNAGGSREH